MSRYRRFARVLAALLSGVVLLAALVAAMAFVGPSISLTEDVLHKESSKDSGMTYEYSGAQWASDLYLVRVGRLTGTEYELRIGPDAEHYYYPVELEFGSDDPRIRHVQWRADGVSVTFESGESIHVPSDNFRSVR